MNVNDTCILICSHDSYEDVWPVFFHFFEKNWNDCPYKVFLNTETKQYSSPTMNVNVINTGNPDDTWCRILKKTLQKLPYRYVIIILEDFFILDQVENKEISRFLDIMRNDEKIACINLRDRPGVISEETKYNLRIRKQNEPYWVCFLPAIWNKEAILDILSPYENAWQFEVFGTERAKLTNWKFYDIEPYYKQVIPVELGVGNTGYGLCQGKWTEPTRKLFADNGIYIDLNERGFCDASKISRTVTVPKMTFKHKMWYFLHGGLPDEDYFNESKFLSVMDQLKLLIRHPRYFTKIMNNKIRIILNLTVGKKADSMTGAIVNEK